MEALENLLMEDTMTPTTFTNSRFLKPSGLILNLKEISIRVRG